MYIQRASILFQLIYLTIILGSSHAKYGAFFTKIECLNYFPEKLHTVNCWVNRTSKISGTFTVQMSFTEDINDATGNYSISIKQGSSIRQYLSLYVDYCKILRSLQTNYALKMILTEIRRVSNYPLECPFKKNKLYYTKEFAVDTKVIPSYVPELDFITSNTLNNYKKHILQVNVFGKLVRA